MFSCMPFHILHITACTKTQKFDSEITEMILEPTLIENDILNN